MMTEQRTHKGDGGLVAGIVLIALGSIFLMDRLELFEMRELFRFWPVILIAIGVHKLLQNTPTSD